MGISAFWGLLAHMAAAGSEAPGSDFLAVIMSDISTELSISHEC